MLITSTLKECPLFRFRSVARPSTAGSPSPPFRQQSDPAVEAACEELHAARKQADQHAEVCGPDSTPAPFGVDVQKNRWGAGGGEGGGPTSITLTTLEDCYTTANAAFVCVRGPTKKSIDAMYCLSSVNIW